MGTSRRRPAFSVGPILSFWVPRSAHYVLRRSVGGREHLGCFRYVNALQHTFCGPRRRYYPSQISCSAAGRRAASICCARSAVLHGHCTNRSSLSSAPGRPGKNERTGITAVLGVLAMASRKSSRYSSSRPEPRSKTSIPSSRPCTLDASGSSRSRTS